MKIQCKSLPLYSFFKSVLISAVFAGLYACSSNTGDNFSDRDPTASASYRVTFTTLWTAASFPTNFPTGAHFSGLVGGTHNEQIKFWETGQIATDGIEVMAESGAKFQLLSEVNAAQADGKAEFALSGGGNSAAASIFLEFDINESYPLVTLVSMVAPSPDWFVGVRDLSLFDNAAGDWKQTVTKNLSVYDAGSDSGPVFTAGDVESVVPISLLSSNPGDTDFVNGVGPGGEFIATMTFVRIK